MFHYSFRVSAPLRLSGNLAKVLCVMLYVIIFNDFRVVAQQENAKDEMLEEINNLRASGCKCGDQYMPKTGPVSWNELLENAAVKHAEDQVKNNFMGHDGSDGSKVSDRVTAAGYNWWIVGENIGKGYDKPKDVVAGWILSEGHCRNMMNHKFHEIGAAKRGDIWVLDLGSERSEGTGQ